MRIGILSFGQSVNDSPHRFVSKKEARKYAMTGYDIVSARLWREKFPKALPSSNPGRHVITKLMIKSIPQLKPPGPSSSMNLFYPVADMSSYASRNLRENWGCGIDQWQARLGTPIPLDNGNSSTT